MAINKVAGIRGPESFYSVQFADDYGFFPVGDLPVGHDWPLAKGLEFAMGARPVSIERIFGYGAYLKHEGFWIYGRTFAEVEAVAQEWPLEG